MERLLKKETSCLLMKTKKYMKFDFIEEHKKLINENGYVWILKLGRKINENYLKQIIKEHGGIILKTPGRENYELYFCYLEDYNSQNVDKCYPNYYKSIFEIEGISFQKCLKNNCWLKITSIKKIPNDYLKYFINKNGESILNGATHGMVNILFTKNDVDLTI